MKKLSFVILLSFGLSSCVSIGPGTVARDRFDYIAAISDSWKSQMLLNLVKIRYGDVASFLDIYSVINQYAVEGSIRYAGNWAQNNQLPWPYNALHSWAMVWVSTRIGPRLLTLLLVARGSRAI